jgi:pimeloyl-ACP methyl ester carboxylesterase
MGTATCEGLEIHYREFGAGPPIVLVHGWGSDLEHNWVATGWVDALRPLRRVIALDVRGHGRSAKPRAQARYGYRPMSRDVLAVMDALHIERADFLGYSMGAFIGICLLADSPKRFASMILGGIGDESPASASACQAIAAGLRAVDSAAIADPIGRAARAFVAANPTSDLEALALSALEMWPQGHPLELGGPSLREARVPVLVVNGSEDRPYVGSDERLVAALPRARLVRIPGADHLSAVSAPRFRDEAIAFLRQPGSPA